MNYILGRDLPFAEKGNKVYIEENELRVYNGDGKKVFIGHADTFFLDGYISQGWIKLIKPRELYIQFDSNMKPIGVSENDRPPHGKYVRLYREVIV